MKVAGPIDDLHTKLSSKQSLHLLHKYFLSTPDELVDRNDAGQHKYKKVGARVRTCLLILITPRIHISAEQLGLLYVHSIHSPYIRVVIGILVRNCFGSKKLLVWSLHFIGAV